MVGKSSIFCWRSLLYYFLLKYILSSSLVYRVSLFYITAYLLNLVQICCLSLSALLIYGFIILGCPCDMIWMNNYLFIYKWLQSKVDKVDMAKLTFIINIEYTRGFLCKNRPMAGPEPCIMSCKGWWKHKYINHTWIIDIKSIIGSVS